MVARKPNDVVQLSKIRIREGLRKKLARQAEFNGTTLNGEIVDRLELSFVRDEKENRDSAIVELLTGDRDVPALVLRRTIFEFFKNPDWYKTKSDADEMAERIAYYIRNFALTRSGFPPMDYEDAREEFERDKP